jgi:hypothetical protein
MGLTAQYLSYIDDAVTRNFGNARGVRMLELGDQVISDGPLSGQTGKSYFETQGMMHTSVDLNGLHGAQVLDLRVPAEFVHWRGQWDIVTNAGTTEHVEPHRSQYETFGIIHDCTRVGGVMLHLTPDADELDRVGAWRYHCTNYYTERFFAMLAKECGYEVQSNIAMNGLRCAVLRKVSDAPFMSDRAKLLAGIARRPIPLHVRVRTGIGEFMRRRHVRP